MKYNPKITVLIPSYNAQNYIQRSIESALNQSFPPYEIVIVDDGSTDDTAKIVRNYSSVVKYYYQENQGASNARNFGITLAKGEWIAFLDSDDEWISTHLENFCKTLEIHSFIQWYGCPFILMNQDTGADLNFIPKSHLRLKGKHSFFKDYMTAFPPVAYFSSPTMIIRKSVFQNVGQFDVSKKVAEDLDMWFRIGMKYPQIGYTYDFGAKVYRRKNSLSTSEFWNPKKSIDRIIQCEEMAKLFGDLGILRAKPRLNYWINKLIKKSIRNYDLKTLRNIKLSFETVISRRNKVLINIIIIFPRLIKLIGLNKN